MVTRSRDRRTLPGALVVSCCTLLVLAFASTGEASMHLGPGELFLEVGFGVEFDESTVTCLRSVLMKPEHEDWVDRIIEVLESSAG